MVRDATQNWPSRWLATEPGSEWPSPAAKRGRQDPLPSWPCTPRCLVLLDLGPDPRNGHGGRMWPSAEPSWGPSGCLRPAEMGGITRLVQQRPPRKQSARSTRGPPSKLSSPCRLPRAQRHGTRRPRCWGHPLRSNARKIGVDRSRPAGQPPARRAFLGAAVVPVPGGTAAGRVVVRRGR